MSCEHNGPMRMNILIQMPAYKCTCPEDWQGMDHTAGCKLRAEVVDGLQSGNERARDAAKSRGYKLHPKLVKR